MKRSGKTRRAARWLMRLAMSVPGAKGSLRRLLNLDSAALLKSYCFDDDNRLFNTLAQASESAALKSLLFADDYRVLKQLLSLRSHEALKAVMLDGDPAWFAMIARARKGEPLADLLFADDAELLRQVCHLRGENALLPVLLSLRTGERAELVQSLLFEGSSGPMELLANIPPFTEDVLQSTRLRGMVALLKKCDEMRPLLPQNDPALESRLRDAVRAIDNPAHVRGRLLDAITEGDVVQLAHGALRFSDRHALWTLLHEILLNEDYYFECESDAPRIIDGGAHMGMAIYYFKSRFPNARITAFEPLPALHAIAEENIRRNDWQHVDLLPYALAGERKEATFHASATWSMAGSLSDRRANLGDSVTEVTVQCVPLSAYLHETVDFLKLDIEGAEDEVIEESAPWLHNVRNIFCEFHQGGGLGPERLTKILLILESAGFDVQIGKSHSFQETSRLRPLTHFDAGASMVIWGRNRACS